MRFQLTIDCDGGAFDGDPGNEVARLLNVAAGAVGVGRLASGDEGLLRDVNGNRCGAWTFGAAGAEV